MILNIGAHGYDKMTSSELKSGLKMILIWVELWKNERITGLTYQNLNVFWKLFKIISFNKHYYRILSNKIRPENILIQPFSAWKQKSAPSPGAAAPAPATNNNNANSADKDGPKNPNVDIDHSMAACRLTGPRRKGKGSPDGWTYDINAIFRCCNVWKWKLG